MSTLQQALNDLLNQKLYQPKDSNSGNGGSGGSQPTGFMNSPLNKMLGGGGMELAGASVGGPAETQGQAMGSGAAANDAASMAGNATSGGMNPGAGNAMMAQMPYQAPPVTPAAPQTPGMTSQRPLTIEELHQRMGIGQ